jgi:hypothetical protein
MRHAGFGDAATLTREALLMRIWYRGDTRSVHSRKQRLVWRLLPLVAITLCLGGKPAEARVAMNDLGVGKLELSGNLQTTNIVRHANTNQFQFISQRNVLRTRVDWQFLNGGLLFDKWKVPGIRKANFFLLYRFSYDSIYDYTPDVQQPFDLHGTNLKEVFERDGVNTDALTLAGGIPQNERDTYKFDNTIREVYADIKLRHIPLSLRIGRQQVVWGESDFFRMLDRVNPLDVSWHGAFEVPPPSFSWDEIRRPLFMVKGLYDLGGSKWLNQMFLEGFWNPGDWYPVKVSFLPRPWGIRLLDPLTNPWDGAYVVGPCQTAPTGRCDRLMNGTKLLKQGDYERWNPLENSQMGVRFHANTPQGINFTLNYLWQRWSGDDGTDFAPVKGLRVFNVDDVANDPATLKSRNLIEQGILPVEYIAPYINTFGLSANYSDDTLTQTVYRVETVLDMGIPMFDRGKLTTLDDFFPGVTEKNMWKGMVGFDRSTWIRFINKKSSFFLTGQFFWHHVINNPDCPDNLGDPKALQSFIRKGKHCLTGGFDLPSARRPKSQSFRDKIRDWEMLGNLAMVGFFRGGSVIPIVAYAVDPMNQWVSTAIWSVDWFLNPQFAVNVTQRYFINPGGARVNFDPWGLSSFARGRSETSLRLTYQF